MLMLHMCAADILFALISVGPTMAITATVPFFYGPNLLCKLTKFLQVIPMYASSFLLVAISADRYQAICRPLASMKSSIYNRPALYSGIAWTAAILFSTPQLYLFEKRNGDCSENYTTALQYQLYVCLFNSVVWLLPSAIAGWLYLCVCKAVWKSTSFSSSLRNNMKKMEHMKLTEKNGGMQAHHKGKILCRHKSKILYFCCRSHDAVRRVGSKESSDREAHVDNCRRELCALGSVLHHFGD